MSAYQHYRDELLCPISGATKDVLSCPLIPPEAAKADKSIVACQEWIFGLRRGSLAHYLDSTENYATFRKDIAEMFRRGEFLLAPTYKTYLDAMRFLDCAGLQGRQANDESSRRPMSALAPASGLYRYVFIACTEAARALQEKFNLPLQTEDDLNGGISPVHNEPYLEGSDQFPVIESLAHPFSVCSWADTRFWRRSTSLTSQWHVLSSRIVSHWLYKEIKPPAWFINASSYGKDDEDLTPSEATGYILIRPPDVARDPVEILKNVAIGEDNYCKKCAKWTLDVPPDAPPPEEDPPHSVYRERRSVRIANRAHPYHRPPKSRSAEEDCSGPLPSPTRKGRRALQTCKRDPIKNPPSWSARNGKYPTQTFCSNDWAYFRYNVYLASFDES
ncbi:hypothetical protein K523DRAFT_302149 [Schizophyllum commune Tattone D]|nr:hypothetical protein K523DRAFT_302149 [Schizophyllum commune Tattone D]